MQVWVNKRTNQATQILVNNGFAGKYAGLIGLGSTISDVKRLLGKEYYEEPYVYYIDGGRGCVSIFGNLKMRMTMMKNGTNLMRP